MTVTSTSLPETRLRAIVAESAKLGAVLDAWAAIDLPDCWLCGGAIAQTAWNAEFGLPSEHGIADFDLVYFDAHDLSPESEEFQAARIRALFPDIGMWIDVKNEARVHLWYPAKFGYAIEPYRSSEHAISTFPTIAGSVGVRPGKSELDVFAPFGLDDLIAHVVRPNKAQITKSIYDAKVARWRACWPALTIVEWDDPADAARE